MFPAKDLLSNLQVDQVLDPAIITTDALSSVIDMLDYNSCLIMASIGESGDTLSGSVKAEVEVQHSDDDSTYVAAPDADVRDSVVGTNVGTLAVIDDAAEDDVVVVGQYVGKKRYVKVAINLTGTHTNGIPVGVVAARGGKRDLPV